MVPQTIEPSSNLVGYSDSSDSDASVSSHSDEEEYFTASDGVASVASSEYNDPDMDALICAFHEADVAGKS